VALPIRRRSKAKFEHAADGSMTLMEHLNELRGRLFKASLGVLVGFGLGFWLLAQWVLVKIQDPYCTLMEAKATVDGVLPPGWKCPFVQLGVTDVFVLKMKIALWVGMIVAAPIWLYQLWAFIAPGLHRHERRWAYSFVAVATPLFAGGAVLAYFVVAKGLEFLLQFTPPNVVTQLEVTKYVDFVTNLMLLFGAALEFPLIVLMFNFAGLASATRLLSWWRVAVFLFFAFSAIATPTPDPFGMSFLALILSALYFAAVGVAFIHDRRKRREHDAEFGELDDDEISPLADDREPIGASSPVADVTPVAAPQPLDSRFDDYT